MTRLRLIALLSLFLTCRSGVAQEMPRAELSAGIYRIDAEVASNEAQREQGLMFRKYLADGEGMVFTFSDSRTYCMWMKNTLIPLSVAFLDAKGVILNIEDMQPQTTDSHCAAGPSRYALEMNLGWFAKHGVSPGKPITGVDKLPPAQ